MNFKKTISRYWLVCVLVIYVFLRLPSLFEPFTYGDEGIYLALGQAAQKGQVWYRDIHDNKPPMLYLVAALAGNFQTYRLIHFAWGAITILAFWQLSRLVFFKNKPAEILTTTTFAVLANLHRFEGNVANAENFMMLLTIAAVYFVYEQIATHHKKRQTRSKKPPFLYTAGTLFGLSALFKVPAAFDFAAAVAFIILLLSQKDQLKKLCFSILYLTLGFLAPILMSFIFYSANKAMNQYWIAAFAQNLPYLSSWSANQAQAGGLPWFLLLRGLTVLAVFILLLFLKNKISAAAKLVLIWFSFTWFAALLSARPYPHYLIQILPPLSLSLGLIFRANLSVKKNLLFWKKKGSFETLVPLILIVVFQLTFSLFHFWTYPNRQYYFNFYQYVLGLKTKQEYLDEFDPKAQNIYQTAQYVRQRTLPSEKIFIWGTEPSIYPLAQRLQVSRYTTSYHIIDFDGYQETLTALENKPPKYIIVSSEEKRPFPELKSFIGQNYTLEKAFGHLKIFRLVLFAP